MGSYLNLVSKLDSVWNFKGLGMGRDWLDSGDNDWGLMFGWGVVILWQGVFDCVAGLFLIVSGL